MRIKIAKTNTGYSSSFLPGQLFKSKHELIRKAKLKLANMETMDSSQADSHNHSLDLYRDEGLHPGDFLLAILSNDLFSAIRRSSSEDISAIAKYIVQKLPPDAYGSKERVTAWMRQGGKKSKI